MKTKSFTLIVATAVVSTFSFGQKINETSAAVEFKNKFHPALMQGKIDDAKNALLSAKKYIDLEAEHPDTKASSKTVYYKGGVSF